MGLDIYFYVKKETHIEEYPENLSKLVNNMSGHGSYLDNKREQTYQIGYFRKFNALHAYIHANYGNYRDDCQPVELDKEAIEELLDICKQIEAKPELGRELLPTKDGFFWGSTEYGREYYSDISKAIELCELILETVDFNEWEIIYRASW